MAHVFRGRYTAQIDEPFAVFLIGMRINKLLAFSKWIPTAAALVLWLVALVIGVRFYTPTLRRQIAVLESQGADSPEFQSLSQRASRIGPVTMLPVLLILFLMVVKPAL